MTDDDILKILKENPDTFISGGELSKKLITSRTAIWKHINNLKKKGYEIISVTNKGYKLSESDILSEEEISKYLNTDTFGKNIRCFDTVDSTNNEAKRQNYLDEGTLFISSRQTGGRGRRGKAWISDSEGLWMSILLKPDIPPYEVSMLTLTAGLCAVLAIRSLCGADVMIKWPNDIVLNKKKLCGILCEMSAETDRTEYAVCGIGINLNQASFPDEIKNIATSLYIETGKKTKRALAASRFLYFFEKKYYEYLNNGAKDILSEYKKYCITIGKEVVISCGGKEYNAIAKGIGKDGSLIVFDGKKRRAVSSGEVSVRGIFGYI